MKIGALGLTLPRGEKSALDQMSDKYFTEKSSGPDRLQMDFIRDKILSECKGPKVLELGCSNGDWTEKLADKGLDVTVIEGSSLLVKKIKRKLGDRVKIVHRLFEEYRPPELYHSIIAACVLEHVEDSTDFLRRISSWLAPKGCLHIVVPNALSLHRRVEFKIGLLKEPLELSPQEIEAGHRRAYTLKSLRQELQGAGLCAHSIQGIFLKPLSSGQMLNWPRSLLEGYNALSDELAEYTAFLYARCSNQKATGAQPSLASMENEAERFNPK